MTRKSSYQRDEALKHLGQDMDFERIMASLISQGVQEQA